MIVIWWRKSSSYGPGKRQRLRRIVFRSPRDIALRILYYHYALESEKHRSHHMAATLYGHSTDYFFLQLRSRVPEMVELLDDLFFQRPRFACINDELDDSEEAGIVERWLRACLQEYYPRPSRFEMGAG